MHKVLIIHHNDRDGIVSAAIINNMIKNNYIGSYEKVEVEFSEQNYTKSFNDILPKQYACYYDEIYVVDYSPSSDEDIQWLIDVNNDEDVKLIWIDHHASSIKAEEKKPELVDNIDGIRIDGISAAALCYLYSIGFEEGLQNIKRAHKSKVSPSFARKLLYEMNTPSCIIYTHRWDIWDHSKKNPTPIYFNYGNRYDLQTWIDRLKLDKAELETLTISDIDSGKENYDEIMKSNEKLCSDNGFETTLTVDGKTYTVFALNKIAGSSMLFGDRIEKYDLVSVFWYSGPDKCFRYSIYSKMRNGVDTSVIAGLLGGGGHPHAAGFRSNEMIYKPIN